MVALLPFSCRWGTDTVAHQQRSGPSVGIVTDVQNPTICTDVPDRRTALARTGLINLCGRTRRRPPHHGATSRSAHTRRSPPCAHSAGFSRAPSPGRPAEIGYSGLRTSSVCMLHRLQRRQLEYPHTRCSSPKCKKEADRKRQRLNGDLLTPPSPPKPPPTPAPHPPNERPTSSSFALRNSLRVCENRKRGGPSILCCEGSCPTPGVTIRGHVCAPAVCRCGWNASWLDSVRRLQRPNECRGGCRAVLPLNGDIRESTGLPAALWRLVGSPRMRWVANSLRGARVPRWSGCWWRTPRVRGSEAVDRRLCRRQAEHGPQVGTSGPTRSTPG